MTQAEHQDPRRILIIDDNPAIHVDIRKILEPEPPAAALAEARALLFGPGAPRPPRVRFRLDFAHQGSEGVQLAKRAASIRMPYALAFVDVRMPPGLDGVETVSLLWRSCPDLQVVLCTAYSDHPWEEIFQRLNRTEGLVILKKPFDPIEVRQLAHTLTEKWLLGQAMRRHLDQLDRQVGLRTQELLAANQQLQREIAEREQAEAWLRASEARYRSILSASPDCIAITDLAGQVLEVSPVALPMLGASREADLLGRPITDFLAPGDRERAGANIALMFQGIMTGPAEYQGLRQDGGAFELEANGEFIRDQAGQPTGMVFIVRDITQRRLAEASLRQEQAFSRSIIDSLPGIFYLYSYPDLRLVLWNRQHETILGYTTEEMAGRRATDWFGPEATKGVREAIDQVMERGFNSFETSILTKSGEPIPVLLTGVRFESQGRSYFVGTGTDLTERHRVERDKLKLQAQFQQIQKMESLGSLAGGIAHDMNNVLGAILGLASAHLGDLAEGSRAHAAFQTIIRAAERGGRTTKSLLGFARQAPAEERDLDLNAVLREEARLLERTTLSRVHLELDLAAGLHLVRGDAAALTHAVMNLCINGVDAMPGNGKLTLRTRNVDPGWIEVLVADTGAGMSREVLEKAMDPFFTTKAVGKGTGLGLAMVYSTVKAHHGQVDIQSEPGLGTQVRLRLPVSGTGTLAPEPAPGPAPAGPDRPLRVLVVDDDDLIQSSMRALLETLGHAVTPAWSGEEALALLADSGLRPDAVILDMNMPGLGGSGTLPRLRTLDPAVPVFLATGRADQAALDLAAAHPFVTLLTKPFSLQELRTRLESQR